jgi:hypothetical protein
VTIKNKTKKGEMYCAAEHIVGANSLTVVKYYNRKGIDSLIVLYNTLQELKKQKGKKIVLLS